MNLAEIAAQFAPKGRDGDLLKLEDGGPSIRVRLYRFKKDGQYHLIGHTEMQVYMDGKYRDPAEMVTGADGQPITLEKALEATRKTLYASGSKEDKKKANSLWPRPKAWLDCVLVDNPVSFRIWQAPESVVQRLLCIAAQKDPEGDGMPKKFENTPAFYAAAERGLGVLCGPKGRDLAVRFDKKAGPSAMYDIVALDAPPTGFKVLPLTEEEAPDPKVTADRIKASKAKKGE